MVQKKRLSKPSVSKLLKKKRAPPTFQYAAPQTPDIELKRNENMKRNAEIMKALGLDDLAAAVVRDKCKERKPAPDAAASDDEASDWEASEGNSADDERSAPKKRASPPSAAPRPTRACKKAKSTLPAAPGEELEGRRLRVRILTEDVGGLAWHHGEVLRHRRRRGRDEHLVRWDTDGADDEWLYLPEEEHHVFSPGEEEAEDAAAATAAEEEGGGAAAYAAGDCVAVAAGDGGERVAFARLEAPRGAGAWLVQWFYEPADLPPEALATKLGRLVPLPCPTSAMMHYACHPYAMSVFICFATNILRGCGCREYAAAAVVIPRPPRRRQVEAGRDLLFSIHEQEIDADTITGRADVVFSAATFRTVTRGQRLCRCAEGERGGRPVCLRTLRARVRVRAHVRTRMRAEVRA